MAERLSVFDPRLTAVVTGDEGVMGWVGDLVSPTCSWVSTTLVIVLKSSISSRSGLGARIGLDNPLANMATEPGNGAPETGPFNFSCFVDQTKGLVW